MLQFLIVVVFGYFRLPGFKKSRIVFVFVFVGFMSHLLFVKNIQIKLIDTFFFSSMFFLFWVAYLRERTVRGLSQEIKKLTQLLKSIFDYCPDPIFIKDTNSKYLAANKAMYDLLEWYTGKKITDINNGSYDEAHDVEKLIFKTLQPSTTEFKYSNEDIERFFQITKVPLVSSKNKVFGLLGMIRDITSDRNYKEQLENTKLLYSSVLENVPFITYLRDLNGNILYSNARTVENNQKNSHSSQVLVNELHLENSEDIKRDNDEIIKTQKAHSVRKCILVENQTFYFDLYKIPILENGLIKNILIIAKDATKEVIIEKQKESFVATLSHDLKTPTIAQLKALEFLLSQNSKNISDIDSVILTEVYNSCLYMKNMINNLISTYKYNSGNICLNNEVFDFSTLIKECCDELKYLYTDRVLSIKTQINVDSSEIYADKLEIKRVVINMLANAISYSNYGSEICMCLDSADNGGIIFSIINSSDVFCEDDLDSCFDQYVTNASKHKTTGTGLGLYLSKQIVELHGGKIFAKKVGNQYVFGFILASKMSRLKELSLKSIV